MGKQGDHVVIKEKLGWFMWKFPLLGEPGHKQDGDPARKGKALNLASAEAGAFQLYFKKI